MAPSLLHHLLARAGADEAVAVVDGAESLTYGAFRARVAALSARLTALGLNRGDRVAILLPKSIRECVALFAVAAAGGVFVPIHPSLRPRQVRHIVGDSGARALLTDPGHADGLDGALDDLSGVRVLTGEAVGVRRRLLPASRPPKD